MTALAYYNSPLGLMLLKAEDDKLCGVWFCGQKHFPQSLADTPALNEDAEIITQTKHWLDCYFSGGKPDILSLNFKPKGTEFQVRVWSLLCSIPYGECISYGQLAGLLSAKTGKATSARAVGSAVGRNPVSIIIPCHRVLGVDGQMTGYAGGIERKAKLLRLEKEGKI